MKHRPKNSSERTSNRLMRAAALAFVVAVVAGIGCQRQLPPELPYDQEAADSIRDDFDRFSDPGTPSP